MINEITDKIQQKRIILLLYYGYCPSIRSFVYVFLTPEQLKIWKTNNKKKTIYTPTNPNLIRSAQEFKWNIWTGEFERKKM